MSMNPFEAIFSPDIMNALNQHTLALNALTQKLDNLTALSAIGGLPTSNGTGTTQPGGITRLNLPVAFDKLLELFVIAYPDQVTPYFDRMTMVVPAGMQNMTMTYTPPQGDVAAVVYKHTMTFDYFSADVLVTHQQDNFPPLLNQVPATEPLVVLGSFTQPIQSKMIHTVTNNTNVDVTFIDDAQMALMTQDFVTEIYMPLMTGQIDLLKALATVFKEASQ